RGADGSQVLEHVFLSVVAGLDGDDDDVGQGIEAGQVLGGVVARLVEAARVEKAQQRRLAGGGLILARETGARFEATSDLGTVRAGQELDDGSLAALCLAEQPEERDGSAPSQPFQFRLQRSVAPPRREQSLESIKHGFSPMALQCCHSYSTRHE